MQLQQKICCFTVTISVVCQQKPDSLQPNQIYGNLPGDQKGLFKLAVQLRKNFNSVIYNTATGYVLFIGLFDKYLI
jgi:hypothetical protein